MNIEAVEELADRFPDTEIIFVESGGDNLTSTFSPDLADLSIFVIDVGEGEKMPRKGGPGITRSDLLIINKIDLAPYVHADLEVMRQDTLRMRGERPFIFTNLMTLEGLEDVKNWLKKYALLEQ
ncbi:Urease accessory protein UreG [compost metagenome]